MIEQNELSGDWTPDEELELKRLISKRLKSKRVGSDIKFTADLLAGEEGEQLLVKALQTGEVKRDFGTGRTGNVFVEVESYGKPSGIVTTEADYWFFVLACEEYAGEVLVGVKTERLRTILEGIDWTVRGGDGKMSKGKLLPVRKILDTRTKLSAPKKQR